MTKTIVNGKDIPMDKLVPLKDSGINIKTSKGFHKILSSIKVAGLIEPLCVYPENGKYVILDGLLRYKACEQLGAKTLPCLIFKKKEAYTFNRMVNKLSSFQEMRMLKKALETIDQKTISEAFGMRSIHHRLAPTLLQQLHPRVAKAFESELIGKTCAHEFSYVKHKRQIQMLNEMKKKKDYSISFARALVLQTPNELRNPKKKQKKAWVKNSAKKKELSNRLAEAEKQYDFCSSLYRRYSADLIKTCIYARRLLRSKVLHDYLQEYFPDVLSSFQEIIPEVKT